MPDDTANYVQITRQFTLDKSRRDTDFLDTLLERAGELYTHIKDRSREHYEEAGKSIPKSKLYTKLCRGQGERFQLHSQSMEAKCRRFYNALDSYFKKLESDQQYENLNPPYKDKGTHPVKWKGNGIEYREDGKVALKNGKHEDREIVFDMGDYAYYDIRNVELLRQNNQYVLSFTFKVRAADEMADGDGLAAIDFGEVHPMAVYDGENVFIYNGGKLRAEFQWFNKQHGKIQKKIERREKGSSRYEEALRERKQLVNDFRNRVKDILDKYVAKLVDTMLEDGVSTLAIGELTGIREGLDYGSFCNQKIHQWCFARLKSMLKTQCKKRGIVVEEVSEEYTSQDCPDCGHRKDTSARLYRCPECGLEYHRDGTAAVNIFRRWCDKNRKYPGCDQVVAAMAPATGIRYSPGMTCWTLSSRKSETILRQGALRREDTDQVVSGPKRQVTKSDEELANSDSVSGSTD